MSPRWTLFTQIVLGAATLYGLALGTGVIVGRLLEWWDRYRDRRSRSHE